MTAAVLFFLLGVVILPYPGLQNDECLFTQPLYTPTAPTQQITVFGRDIPLMLMTYLGDLKTLLYIPIFKLWKPNVWSIRLPALLTAAFTIWMFGTFLFRIGGSFAAIAGSFLLALDPIYLLTSVFDWGPVVLQHLLLVAAVYCLFLFHGSGSVRMLGGGFFALGLGMWDKALFSWMLAGLFIASLIFLTQDIRRRLSIRNVLIAIGAFLLGAAPLVIYNVRNNVETFRGNAKMAPNEIWPKTLYMPGTLNGSGLFGYLIREESDDSPRAPQTVAERASAGIRARVGEHRKDLLPWALLAAFGWIPFWWRRWRVVGFAFVTVLVAWLLMSSTKDAGASVHHIVLMWPVPQFLLAFALGAAAANKWPRRVAVALVALVCVSNLLVINQYFYNVQRVGPGSSWTDAIFPLKDTLVKLKPAHVNLMDWGYEFNLQGLTRGKMEIHWGAEPGERATPNESDERLLKIFLDDWAPESLWIRRVEPIEVRPGTEQRYREHAAKRGFVPQSMQIIGDRNGRKMFEIYRFVKVSP